MAGKDEHPPREAPTRSAADERRERTAAALRENLRRRKQQQRGRADAPTPAGEKKC